MTAPLTATEERRERELEDLLQELGSDGRIRVWHVVDGKPSYAGEMSLDGFSLDAVLEIYGGGDKSLVFYQGREKRDTLRVSLDPSIPPKNPRSKSSVAPSIAPSSGVADMTALFAAMAQGNMAMMQMMQTMTAQNSAAMNTMLGAVATALTAKKDERDPMDMALKMAELLKPNGAATPASELFNVFEKGMNVAKNLGGNDEDGTIALAREGLGVVAKIVENNKPQAPAPVRQIPAPVAPGTGRVLNGRPDASAVSVSVGTSENPQQTPNDASGAGTSAMADRLERPWVAAARPKSGLLLLAIGNVRPDTAADMIADNLTDEQFADLLDDIETGTPAEFCERFASHFGVVFDDNSARWMLECVASLKALVEVDGDLPSGEETGTHGA